MDGKIHYAEGVTVDEEATVVAPWRSDMHLVQIVARGSALYGLADDGTLWVFRGSIFESGYEGKLGVVTWERIPQVFRD